MKDNKTKAEDGSSPQDQIVQDDVDSDYEPSEDEILEYAKYLGMDPDKDKEYFWIAKEGLKAPLPAPWKACNTNEGEIYYFNFQTGESQWDHPLDNHYKQKFQELKEDEASLDNAQPQRNQQNKFQLNLPISQLTNPNQQPVFHYASVIQNNSSGTFKQNVSNLQDSGISGLSYSHNTNYGAENISDIQKKVDFDTGKRIEFAIDKDDVNESLEFSNLDEDPKSKRSPKSRALEEVEAEHRKKIKKLEEELEMKFNQVVSDCEITYQREAQKIQNNFELELKNVKEISFGDKGHKTEDLELEAKKKRIEEDVNKEAEVYINQQLEALKRDHEKKAREIEEDFNRDLDRYIAEIKTNNDLEIINQKRTTKRKIDDLGLQRDSILLKKETEFKDTNGSIEKRKAELKIEHDRKLRELETEESKKLQKEIENYKKELAAIIERERQGVEPSTYRRNLANDVGLRKIELREIYLKKIDHEKQRLYEENEKSIKDMLEYEKVRIGENAAKAFEASIRAEFDKKYLTLQAEKAATVEANQKRLDDHKKALERKFENDQKNLARDYKIIIDRLSNELVYLNSEIAQKEGLKGQSSRLFEEIRDSEKESLEKDKKIARLAKELEDLSAKVTDNAKMLEKFRGERTKLEESIKKKNELLLKIDDMQKRVEEVDKTIEQIKLASTNRLNETTSYNTLRKNSTERLSQNLSNVSLARIVKEVEDIKGMLKKKKASRSFSAEKVLVKKKFTKNNITIDHGKNYSFDDDEEEEFDDFEEFEDKNPRNILKGIHKNQPNNPIKKLPIANLGRLEEINDLENQELSEIPSTASFKGDPKTSHLRINWAKLVPSEKEQIQALDEILKRKKLEVKENQADLLREQNEYKQEYAYFKSMFDNGTNNPRKARLDQAKKALNAKIQDYNSLLNHVRNQEDLLNKKRDLHKAMELSLSKILNDQSNDQSELEFLYKNYREIKIELEDNEPLTSEPRALEPFAESCDEVKLPPKEDYSRNSHSKITKSYQKSTELSREKRHPIKIEDEEINSQYNGNISDLRDPSDYSRVRSRGAFFEERSFIQERSFAHERSSIHDRQRLLNLRHQLKAEKYFDRYDDLIRKYSSHY